MNVLSVIFLVSLFISPHSLFANDHSTSKTTTLKFVTTKPDHPRVWDEAIARFELANPSIRIHREIAPASSTAYHDLLTQKLKNHDSSMDLFLMDVVWPAEFAAAGWALAIDQHFPQSEQKRFLAGPIQAGTFQGHIYGVPSRIDSGMLYYRLDLLQKYGLTPPLTWGELVEHAQTILQGEDHLASGLRGYSGQFKQYEGLVCNMLEFIGGHKEALISEGGTHSRLASSDSLQAVKFVRENIINHLATPAVLTYQEPESLAIFVQGKAVFHRNWPYAWGIINNPKHSKVVGKVGVGPLPHFPGGPSVATLGGWMYGISAYSRHPQEAWTFIQFMTSPDIQKLFAVSASLAPSRVALYEDPDVLEKNPQYRAFLPVFRTAVSRPRSPAYPMISNVWQRYFSRVLAFPDTDILKEAQVADIQINRFLRLGKIEHR